MARHSVTLTLPAFQYFKCLTKKEKREVHLDVHDHQYLNRACTDCHCEITKDQVYGRDIIGRSYCQNCVDLPAGLSVWTVTFKTRKSVRNPKGTLKIRRVGNPLELQAFFHEVNKKYLLISQEIRVILSGKE